MKLIRKALHSARPRICEDVAVWGRQHGLDVLELHPPVYGDVAPLVQDDTVAQAEIERHLPDLERPQSLVVLRTARIRDNVGFVFLPDGSVCYQGNWFRPYLTDSPSYRARFRKKRFVKGDIFSLLGLWSGGFYHWFHDTLPRLWNALPHLPPHTRFLIHKKPRAYQLESLNALGISIDRLEYQNDRGDAVVERLWFATPVGHSSFTATDSLEQIADKLKKKFGCESVTDKKRIYISRRKAGVRRVLNESEIEPLLILHGIQIVVMEDLSFEKQVEICSSANVLIGPHGAGLINLLYCAKGSKIGEIGMTGVFPHYLSMARQVGHSFYRFMADNTEHGDLILDVNSFQSWLVSHF